MIFVLIGLGVLSTGTALLSFVLAIKIRHMDKRQASLEAVVVDLSPESMGPIARRLAAVESQARTIAPSFPITQAHKNGAYCGVAGCYGKAAPKCQNALCVPCCRKLCKNGGHT
jgi:hypothetical protein